MSSDVPSSVSSTRRSKRLNSQHDSAKKQKVDVAEPTNQSTNPSKKKAKASKSTASSTNQPTNQSALSIVHSDGKVRCWSATDDKSKGYHDREWARPLYYFPSSIKSFIPFQPNQSINQSTNPAAYQPDAESEKEYHLKLNRLYAILCLEQLQAGLSWSLIMKRWDEFFSAMDQFDVDVVAQYDQDDVDRLMHSDQMIRNKIKIESMLHNAKLIQEMETKQRGSFFLLLWQFHFPPTINQPTNQPETQSTKPSKKDASHHIIHPHERILETGTHLSSWMRSDFKTKAIDREKSDGVHPSKTVHLLTKAMKAAGVKFMGETCCLNFMQAAGLVNHHAHGCFAFQECEDEYRQVEIIYRQLEELNKVD